MKTHNNIQTQLILTAIIAIGGMVGLLAYRHNAPIIADTTPLLPTQPIDDNQGIGGVPIQEAQRRSGVAKEPPSSPPSNNSKSEVSPSMPSLSRSSPRDTRRAPKQQEIEAGIDTHYKYRALGTPNDPLYVGSTYAPWALQKTGAPAVWDITQGSEVVVAVIDTGYALQHEDLTTQWYNNPGENGMTSATDKSCWTGVSVNKSTDSCDNDSNGYIDDWRGWNFYGRYSPGPTPCAESTSGTYISNNNPQAGSAGDDIWHQTLVSCGVDLDGYDPFGAVSHGTASAGLVGAATNNNVGVASFNWHTKIMPLQALGDDGSGWTGQVVAAIYYAVDNGADIISLSLGGPDHDSALEGAISYAYENNVVVVAAAGNCGSGNESGCNPATPGAMSYPALYDHVISVGATDSQDNRANFSSYGEGLDVVAPGSGSIVSTLISRGTSPYDPSSFNYTNAYATTLYGTSFSTPIVSSIISLVKSIKPAYTVDEITALVDGSARKVPDMNGALWTTQYGHGVINAASIATIANSLQTNEPASPMLLQTGDHRSEHSFSSSAPMSSGCNTSPVTYCTVRIQNTSTGSDRYLPYTLSNQSGQAGWQWPGSILGHGEWVVRAMQGPEQSGVYYLFSK